MTDQEKSPVAGPASKVAAAGSARLPRRVYESGGTRRVILSFVFAILLPFFVSLPAMFTARVIHGLWHDMLPLAVVAVAFLIVMALLLVELVHAVRTRVELGPTTMRLTLPRHGGLLPAIIYDTHELPYADVTAVETRREIYGGSVAPVIMRGARLLTRSTDAIRLGYVNEINTHSGLPVPEIAAEIARRAGTTVTDKGSVHRTWTKKLAGVSADAFENTPVTEEELAHLRLKHRRFVLALVMVLGGLLVAGAASDALRSGSVDLGERSAVTVHHVAPAAPAPAPSPAAPK